MNAENPDRRPSTEATQDPGDTSAAASPDTEAERKEPEQERPGGRDAPPAEDDLEADHQRDRYLRLAAEYDNFRKRTERERGESWARAQAQIVERLLDPLDDLQRVADFSADNTTVESLLEGVHLVERKLFRVLEGAGLAVMDPKGEPFDPELHEGLMTTPTEDPAEDDTVAEVFQKGYQFKDVLLRPARVQVKKYDG